MASAKVLVMEDILSASSNKESIVGESPALNRVLDLASRVAPYFRTALITGATGTGKELLAHKLHRQSGYPRGPFIVCNCASLTETLAESELFGHRKGAFTGASNDRKGLFQAAEYGTLFLDEIGELPLSLQAKLLRAIQFREILPVGSTSVQMVDVRIIAATHRDLKQMVITGRFREDLYYRLAMLQLHLPPLKERHEDLFLLCQQMVDRYSEEYGKAILGLTARAQSAFAQYDWPGNIRELENVIGYSCLVAEGDWIDVEDLPPDFRTSDCSASQAQDLVSLQLMKRRYARRVLKSVGDNHAEAARVLEISRATLRRLVELPATDSALSILSECGNSR